MNFDQLQKTEAEPQPENVTSKFLELDCYDFEDYMETLRGKPTIIEIDWIGLDKARALKAYVSMYQDLRVSIKATQEQYEEGWNVFSSGVKWEKIEKIN